MYTDVLTPPPFIPAIDGRIYVAGIPSWRMRTAAARQASPNWCWAACIQMVLRYFGIRVSQSDIVAAVFGLLADVPAGFAEIVASLNGFPVTANGFPAVVQATTLLLSDLELAADLALELPIIVGMRRPGQAVGHACLLTAITFQRCPACGKILFGTVTLRDPSPWAPENLEMSWAEFCSSFLGAVRVRVQPA